MRKLILSVVLLAAGLSLFAQKIEDVQEKISKGKFDEAKEKMDKIMADPKNQNVANNWYYKGVVYLGLSADSTKKDMDYRWEAFNAFKRYQELDPKNILMTLEQNGRLFQLYESYYKSGVDNYNAKDFAGAFNSFKNALLVEEYINKKGFTYGNIALPALDTSLILNTAAMALRSNQEDVAMQYYQRLADAKLAGKDNNEIYFTLIEYFEKKKDEANRSKYIKIGRELYPDNPYWLEADLSPLKDDKQKLFAKYEELIANTPSNFYLAYNYAVELFNYIYAGDKAPADAGTVRPKVEPAIAAAIKIQNTPEANLLMVRYLSEEIYKAEDSLRTIKGTTPADTKKRQGITADLNARWDKMIPYAEAAFNGYAAKTDLKGSDKGNLKYLGNTLVDYYTTRKQADKAKSYQDKLKGLGL